MTRETPELGLDPRALLLQKPYCQLAIASIYALNLETYYHPTLR